MRYDTWTRAASSAPADCLAVGIFDDAELSPSAREIDEAAKGALRRLLQRGDFPGRAGESLLVGELSGITAGRVLLVGLGGRSGFNRKAWRRAVITAAVAAGRVRVATLAIALDLPDASKAGDAPLDDYLAARIVAEQTGLSLYRTNDRKTSRKPKAPALSSILFCIGSGVKREAETRRGLSDGAAFARGSFTMRDLANLPGNLCTPGYLAKTARDLGRRHKALRVKVLDEAAIRREKMGCLLAVAQGSDEPPHFIVMEYRGPKRAAGKAPIVLVGKGITFDTGGISLKDPGGMDEMKFDMSGAACVVALMGLVADLALPLHVVALVPTCENMPSGRAIKPGDIVTSAAGQTVEILNTDAEGRLILCDALHYARRFKPDVVIDVATLTGACVVALGAHHSGLMTHDDALANELLESGRRADDRAWRLPVTDEYGEQLKSNFADMANVGGREGGASTAAAFLAKFTQNLRWAHLDVAGTAWHSGALKGSSGRPLPLLADFLVRRARA